MSLIVSNSVRDCFLSFHSLKSNWQTMGEEAASWLLNPLACWQKILVCCNVLYLKGTKKGEESIYSKSSSCSVLLPFYLGSTGFLFPIMAVPALDAGRSSTGSLLDCSEFLQSMFYLFCKSLISD